MPIVADQSVDAQADTRPTSFDPATVLRQMVDAWHPPDDSADGEPISGDADGPRFSLAELADQEAASYRAWANPVGEMFARHMDELALKIRMTDATTPQEYEARIEVYEDEIRGQWESRGFDAGLDSARNQCRCGRALYD